MKGDVQLMSLKYLLRQGTRRYGTRYEEATKTLINLHNTVGLPEKALDEIREELEQVLEVINDQSIREETMKRISYDRTIPPVYKSRANTTEYYDHSIIADYKNPQAFIAKEEEKVKKTQKLTLKGAVNKRNTYQEQCRAKSKNKRDSDKDNKKRIYTIGHSDHEISKFLQILTKNRITTLVDVRSNPSSKRNTQYNMLALAADCRKQGITYRHCPQLGNKNVSITYSHRKTRRTTSYNKVGRRIRNLRKHSYGDNVFGTQQRHLS